MSFILEKCKGAYRIDLVTHPENKNALRLYASLGFKVESRSENFFGDGGPRLLLALMPPRFALPAMQAAGSAIFCGFL